MSLGHRGLDFTQENTNYCKNRKSLGNQYNTHQFLKNSNLIINYNVQAFNYR